MFLFKIREKSPSVVICVKPATQSTAEKILKLPVKFHIAYPVFPVIFLNIEDIFIIFNTYYFIFLILRIMKNLYKDIN